MCVCVCACVCVCVCVCVCYFVVVFGNCLTPRAASHAHTHTPFQLHTAKVALDSHDGFEHGIHVQITKEISDIIGCSEFFHNLNFALSQTEAHSPWVTLSAPAVKLERKVLHFASTSIAAVCGECVCLSVMMMCVVLFSWEIARVYKHQRLFSREITRVHASFYKKQV